MRKLEFSQHNFDVLHEAYDELKEKYDERGMAMRETGAVVRSLFMPYIKRAADAVSDISLTPRDAVTKVQDILDELNKHTLIG